MIQTLDKPVVPRRGRGRLQRMAGKKWFSAPCPFCPLKVTDTNRHFAAVMLCVHAQTEHKRSPKLNEILRNTGEVKR